MKNVRNLVVFVCLLPLLAAGCSTARRAGTGDVAFRLVWDGTSDLDLLVEDPGGTCIFWGRRTSDLGGVLDVDCNAGTDRICDHPIENVFWPTGKAPAGTYRVWVRAHALLPAEAPLPYALQVLHGTKVSWTHRGTMTELQETDGPFLYTFPGREVILDQAEASPRLPEECKPDWTRELPPLPEGG